MTIRLQKYEKRNTRQYTNDAKRRFLSFYRQGKVLSHPCPPYALSWTEQSIVVAGCDKRVVFYGPRDGRVQQQFDYSRQQDEHELTVATCSPGGHAVAIGSYDRYTICL